MFAKRVWAVAVCGRRLMAIIFSYCAITTAAAAILQVFKANLMGTVAAPFKAALNIWRVSIEEHRAYSHCPW